MSSKRFGSEPVHAIGAGMQTVRKVVTGLGLPASVRVAYGGLYAEQQKSFQDLLLVLALAIVLVLISSVKVTLSSARRSRPPSPRSTC